MKKLLAVMITLSLVFVLGACAETGDYEPGVYFGYTEGHSNTTAVVFIDENGFIAEIFVDAVYLKSDPDGAIDGEVTTYRGTNDFVGYATTKRSLDFGCGYNMHPPKSVEGEAPDCSVEGEMMWHEQVDAIVAAVIEAQEMPDFPMDGTKFDQEDDDAIAGVTINVNSYIAAIEAALEQAGK